APPPLLRRGQRAGARQGSPRAGSACAAARRAVRKEPSIPQQAPQRRVGAFEGAARQGTTGRGGLGPPDRALPGAHGPGRDLASRPRDTRRALARTSNDRSPPIAYSAALEIAISRQLLANRR